ncbi:MAG: hypothetical protein ACOC7S_00700 [Planctomycetota bacterium]
MAAERGQVARGKWFQERAASALAEHYGVSFLCDEPVSIGSLAKEHRFDFVSVDRTHVGDCMNYSWTKSGNVPSAKMGFVNQAVFFLSFLPESVNRFVVLRRDYSRERGESLAHYYHRTYKHLLRGVGVLEPDTDSGRLREL